MNNQTVKVPETIEELKVIQKEFKREAEGAVIVLTNQFFNLGLEIPTMGLPPIEEIKEELVHYVMNLYITSTKIKQLQHQAKTKELN